MTVKIEALNKTQSDLLVKCISMDTLKTHSEIIEYQKNKNRVVHASTKNRSSVRGGGRKPYKQKGTGRARQGTIRSPLKVGGGVIFGPSLRSRDTKCNKNVVRKSINQALAESILKIKVLNSKQTELLKTKDFRKIYEPTKDNANRNILIIVSLDDFQLTRVLGNVPNIKINFLFNISVINIHYASDIYISSSAIKILKDKLS